MHAWRIARRNRKPGSSRIASESPTRPLEACSPPSLADMNPLASPNSRCPASRHRSRSAPSGVAGHCRQPVEDEGQIRQAHADAELLGGDRLELMGLVDDQRFVRTEHLALALGAGEQERMVRDNNGRICGAAARAHHVAARVCPVGAGRSEAVGDVGRDAAPQLLLVAGQVDLRAVAGRRRCEPGEDLQLEADRRRHRVRGPRRPAPRGIAATCAGSNSGCVP